MRSTASATLAALLVAACLASAAPLATDKLMSTTGLTGPMPKLLDPLTSSYSHGGGASALGMVDALVSLSGQAGDMLKLPGGKSNALSSLPLEGRSGQGGEVLGDVRVERAAAEGSLRKRSNGFLLQEERLQGDYWYGAEELDDFSDPAVYH